jgi:uncharacterized protein YeeX (DUF496 family)
MRRLKEILSFDDVPCERKVEVMDGFMLELELLKQLEEEQSDSMEVEEKEEIMSEMGQMAYMFQRIDEYLIEMEENSDP